MATDISFLTQNASKVVEACLAYGCDMMFHWHDDVSYRTLMFLATHLWLADHLITNPNWRQGDPSGDRGGRWLAFSSGGSRGGGPGIPGPLPLIFTPNWGPKGRKKILRPPHLLSPLSEGQDPPLFKLTTGSVLSLFIVSMFTVIQESISRTKSSIANFARSAEDDSKVRYNFVSSANKWKSTLWCLIISPKGEV